ncbi:MAG: hypothetical protein KA436_10070 [Oligoflexales bacterium]|nr:hypothetical protein [Oligoflexales bacterium]
MLAGTHSNLTVYRHLKAKGCLLPLCVLSFSLIFSCKKNENQASSQSKEATRAAEKKDAQVRLGDLQARSGVDGTSLALTSPSAHAFSMGSHSVLQLTAQEDPRADYLEYVICTAPSPKEKDNAPSQKKCSPSMDKPGIFTLGITNIPLLSQGDYIVSLRSCTRRPLKSEGACGRFVELTYTQSQSQSPLKPLLTQIYLTEQKIRDQCHQLAKSIEDTSKLGMSAYDHSNGTQNDQQKARKKFGEILNRISDLGEDRVCDIFLNGGFSLLASQIQEAEKKEPKQSLALVQGQESILPKTILSLGFEGVPQQVVKALSEEYLASDPKETSPTSAATDKKNSRTELPAASGLAGTELPEAATSLGLAGTELPEAATSLGLAGTELPEAATSLGLVTPPLDGLAPEVIAQLRALGQSGAQTPGRPPTRPRQQRQQGPGMGTQIAFTGLMLGGIAIFFGVVGYFSMEGNNLDLSEEKSSMITKLKEIGASEEQLQKLLNEREQIRAQIDQMLGK